MIYEDIAIFNSLSVSCALVGSPFHPKVVDARKVRVVGGWQTFLDANNQMHLVCNEIKRVEFDCVDAGKTSL